MGKPLMIQEEDERVIDELKEALGAKTKIEVVRRGLKLLDHEVKRNLRIERWKTAAHLVQDSSRRINREFQRYSQLKRIS